MHDVITIGSATRDIFLKSRHFEIIEGSNGLKYEAIPFGQKFLVNEVAYASGGGGTNTAVTFARQGLRVATISVIGDDSTGRDIVEELKSESIDVSFIKKHKDMPSAFSVILVHKSGERSILSFKGEGQHFISNEIDFGAIKCKRLYIDSTGGNLDFLSSLSNYAKDNSIPVAWNPGGLDISHPLDDLKEILSRCDLFFLNKEESSLFLKKADISIEEILLEFRRLSPLTIITVTDGKNGSYTLGLDSKIYKGSIPESPIVDATGAGDAFASGFVSEFMMSGDIVESIKFGTANATSVVAYYGAKQGILKLGDAGMAEIVKVEIL